MELFPYVDLKNQLSRKLDSAAVGAPGGVAKLGSDGRVPFAQLPPTLAELSGVVEYRENKGKPGGYASLSGTGVVPASQLPYASVSAKGAVERATLAEVAAGIDPSRYVSPQGVKQETDKVRADMTTLSNALDGKAAKEHTHSLLEVESLEFWLNTLASMIAGKAAKEHTHGYADLPRVVATAYYIDGEWEERPTSDLDVPVWWIGGSLSDPPPAPGPRDIHFPDAD